MGDANAWADEWEIPSEEARPGSQFGGLRLMAMSLVFSLERFPEAEADRGGKEHDSTYSW